MNKRTVKIFNKHHTVVHYCFFRRVACIKSMSARRARRNLSRRRPRSARVARHRVASPPLLPTLSTDRHRRDLETTTTTDETGGTTVVVNCGECKKHHHSHHCRDDCNYGSYAYESRCPVYDDLGYPYDPYYGYPPPAPFLPPFAFPTPCRGYGGIPLPVYTPSPGPYTSPYAAQPIAYPLNSNYSQCNTF